MGLERRGGGWVVMTEKTGRGGSWVVGRAETKGWRGYTMYKVGVWNWREMAAGIWWGSIDRLEVACAMLIWRGI